MQPCASAPGCGSWMRSVVTLAARSEEQGYVSCDVSSNRNPAGGGLRDPHRGRPGQQGHVVGQLGPGRRIRGARGRRSCLPCKEVIETASFWPDSAGLTGDPGGVVQSASCASTPMRHCASGRGSVFETPFTGEAGLDRRHREERASDMKALALVIILVGSVLVVVTRLRRNTPGAIVA